MKEKVSEIGTLAKKMAKRSRRRRGGEEEEEEEEGGDGFSFAQTITFSFIN